MTCDFFRNNNILMIFLFDGLPGTLQIILYQINDSIGLGDLGAQMSEVKL